MASSNRHGLDRNIPAQVRRRVRRNCKFGCVICRSAYFQYEHFDPTFRDALTHSASGICCLCANCHADSTTGRLDTETVRDAYRRISSASPESIEEPHGAIHLREKEVELSVGGLTYTPALRTILRYHGTDLIRVRPGTEPGEPGLLDAIFTDGDGEPVLTIEDNALIGSTKAWDIEVVGRRLSIRQAKGRLTLRLRFEPPSRVVVERLDMRVHDAYVIATEEIHALGRLFSDGQWYWAFALVDVGWTSREGAAIEFASTPELEALDRSTGKSGQRMANPDGRLVLSSGAGVLIKPMGIAIASRCGGFSVGRMAIGGPCPPQEVRRAALRDPGALGKFLVGCAG